ncbi:hypothetical protein CRG98_018666 [Punica granatum]|uniref:Uncharacterized protein n=1 Tax=Punica granatum TaxID=22663 RepID=A0A2I0JYR3_PUNGR|nr:hypothetical protein CRG98_018666 [Punica granatum]
MVDIGLVRTYLHHVRHNSGGRHTEAEVRCRIPILILWDNVRMATMTSQAGMNNLECLIYLMDIALVGSNFSAGLLGPPPQSTASQQQATFGDSVCTNFSRPSLLVVPEASVRFVNVLVTLLLLVASFSAALQFHLRERMLILLMAVPPTVIIWTVILTPVPLTMSLLVLPISRFKMILLLLDNL